VIHLLLLVLGVVIWIALVVVCVWWAWLAFTGHDEYPLVPYPIARPVTVALLAAAVILPAGVISGEVSLFTEVPDGCYRIGHTTSTGVTVIPGKVPTVVPIVISGKTYEPIACPA